MSEKVTGPSSETNSDDKAVELDLSVSDLSENNITNEKVGKCGGCGCDGSTD